VETTCRVSAIDMILVKGENRPAGAEP
jgi:hypothetical protein